MFISDTAIKRPVLTVVAMLMFVVFGIVALLAARHRRVPGDRRAGRRRRRSPIRARRPTSSSARWSIPIEEAISGISGVDRMRSSSLDSFANIIVEFDFSKDPRLATQEIRDKISGDPQRPADRDGGADPHAVRPGRSADRVADAVVAGAVAAPS